MFCRHYIQAKAPAASRRRPLLLLPLALFLAGPSAAYAQDIVGNDTIIDGNVTLDVCGNTGGINSDCTSTYIPASDSDAKVTGNTLTVDTKATVPGSAIGGRTEGNGEVSKNVAEINGKVTGVAYGGYGYGPVTDNRLTVNGTVGTVGTAGGGISMGEGNVTKNTLIVNQGATVNESAAGGASKGTGLVDGNKAEIYGHVIEDAYGGHIENADSKGNVTNNTLVIGEGGQVDGDAVGGVNMGSGEVTGNTLTINGKGTVGADAYGGWGNGSGNVTGNELTVEADGLVVGDAIGGYIYEDGDGNVSGNVVTINGEVGRDVYGGFIDNEDSAANVTGNTITINAVVENGDIYGGYTTGSGNATGNTITLNASASGEMSGGLYGGFCSRGNGDYYTGNTLIVTKDFKADIAEVQNFDIYEFDLAGRRAGDTIITITGGIPTDLTLATGPVILNNMDLADIFSQGGDALVLISEAENGRHLEQQWTVSGGLSRIVRARLEGEGWLAIVSDNGIETNPQARALNQGSAVAGETLSRGQDALVNSGLDQAAQAAYQCPDWPAFFTSVHYGDYRVKTGGRGHNDVDGWSALAGLAWAPDQSEQGWLAGFFFEGGGGRYRAYNSFPFADLGSVRSSGDVKYYGGGLFARYLFENRFRLEASARYGRTETDYRAEGWLGGARPKYDLDRNYFGGHLGLGYEAFFDDLTSLDLSARYLWTRQRAKTVTILDERVRFDDYDSSRLRAGGRLQREVSPGVKPFLGLYGEYEFDGESSSRNLTTGDAHEKIKSRGATGIVEAGVSISTGEPCCGFTLDMSVDGQFGRRKGWGGQVALTWSF